MKKIFYFIASAIVALGAVACQNDIEDSINNGQQTEGVSIKVTIAEQSRVDLGEVEADGRRKLSFTEGDVLVVRSDWQSGDNYLFTYTKKEGDVYTFTCADEGVSSLVGTQPNIFYLGGLREQADVDAITSYGAVCRTEAEDFSGIGMYSNPSMQSGNLGEEGYVVTLGAQPLLKFTANEPVTFKSERYPFFVNGESVEEYTTKQTGEIYLPVLSSSGIKITMTVTTESGFNKSFESVLDENKIYNLGTIEAPAPVVGYSVYVYNDSKWSDVYIYSWDANETYLAGAWPGTKMTKTTVNGVEYYKHEFSGDLNGKAINMIFNNNSGAQTSDISAVLNSDLYYLSSGGVIEDPANPEPPQTYKIYAYQYNITWNPFNLYCWGSKGNYAGNWPGTKLTNTTSINGYTYYVYDMPASAVGQNIQMIFNNGASQTKDSASIMFDKDLYVRVNAGSVTVLDDPNNPLPEEEVLDYKVYVKNSAGWSKMYIYAWNNLSAGSWPGTQMTTEVINGTTYYVHEFTGYGAVTGASLIFNNGSGSQTGDITNVSLTKDLFYEVKSNKTATLIADPRQ